MRDAVRGSKNTGFQVLQKNLPFFGQTARFTFRPEGRGPRRFFDFSGRELTFFRNSLEGEGGKRRRSVAKGWGPGTRERQHASRDTIPERWGKRTHPRTQAHLSLNRCALAAARLQLPTLASGVGEPNFTLDISVAAKSLEATTCCFGAGRGCRGGWTEAGPDKLLPMPCLKSTTVMIIVQMN